MKLYGMAIKTGVMVMKNEKAWGTVYEDGHFTEDGWGEAIFAPIHDPKFCIKTTDVTYKDSPYIKELLTAKLVRVKRITKLFFGRIDEAQNI
ncbi:MAG: hypothetical protein PHC68_00420 [Syntrophorhabdaceae bacterium]|nr:hypothetical protein [Syntrophorhabdaceae bacterium]